jgi:hypothetical protein
LLAVAGPPSGAARNRERAITMASDEPRSGATAPDAGPETQRMPFMQRVLDNPFLLLFLGVTVPTVLYVIWGVMEIIQIPLAP